VARYGPASVSHCITLIASHNPVHVTIRNETATIIGTEDVTLLAGSSVLSGECTGALGYSITVPQSEFYQGEVNGIPAGAISDADLRVGNGTFDLDVTITG
jgi:hypothetical protein